MSELSFEAKLLRLDEILEGMQSGSVALKDSVQLFEEGMSLLGQLREELGSVEKKVKILISKDEMPAFDDYEGENDYDAGGSAE